MCVENEVFQREEGLEDSMAGKPVRVGHGLHFTLGKTDPPSAHVAKQNCEALLC